METNKKRCCIATHVKDYYSAHIGNKEDKSQTVNETTHTRIHYFSIRSRYCKQICKYRKQINDCLGVADGRGQGRDDKGAEEMFGGDGFHYCDCCDGVKSVHICQNVSNYSFIYVKFMPALSQ